MVPRAPQFPIYTAVNIYRPPSQPGKAFLELAREKLMALQKQPLG